VKKVTRRAGKCHYFSWQYRTIGTYLL
jgi:hypothetical protein